MIDPAVLAPERVRPLRRDEYDRLVALGCFEDERIELLEGQLVAMSPQGAGQIHVISKLNKLLVQAAGERALVRPQGPFAASDESEPEPDLALVPNAEYWHDHATRAFLVVEVADSSLRKDRQIKGTLYARAGVREYWIVNLQARVVEVHRNPTNGRYATVTTHGPGETLVVEAFPDIAVPIGDVLPPS